VKPFRLPDLGEGLTEAEIVSWHVAVGDEVVSGQTLVSMETDKAVVDIPSPESGRVTAIHGAPGERMTTGAVLVEFADGAREDAGALVGRLPTHEVQHPVASGGIKAMPAVRALAARLGVDLAKIVPTGPLGQITATDVENAAGPAAGEKIRGVRRAMADNMTRAHAAVVPATAMDVADVSAWWQQGADPTVRLIRAVVAGCAASPSLNASYDGRRQTRVLHDKVDLGIAVDTEEGLFVPVLRDAGHLGPAELRAELDRLKEQVRARTVAPDRLRGQTITLSNFGSIGGRFAALVVVPPQVAILGAGRVVPGIVKEPSVVHPTLPLSLTFDHRVVTGGEAARFMAAVIGDLELAA
jgi:2-oxoisovalerate dehydrogenase E2 component (dihydrolipoyl transacylase)